MIKQKEYETTTNRRVYNLLHKEIHAHCSFCKWHPDFWHFSENQYYKNFDYYITEGVEEKLSKYPNWKLVSKNRKQWMKKRFKKIKKPCYRNHNKIWVQFIW